MSSGPGQNIDERYDCSSASEQPPDRLGEIAQIAMAIEAREIAADAEALAERRFYVTCIGQLKRGKSTLLAGRVLEDG